MTVSIPIGALSEYLLILLCRPRIIPVKMRCRKGRPTGQLNHPIPLLTDASSTQTASCSFPIKFI
jgi:hypothetical protein